MGRYSVLGVYVCSHLSSVRAFSNAHVCKFPHTCETYDCCDGLACNTCPYGSMENTADCVTTGRMCKGKPNPTPVPAPPPSFCQGNQTCYAFDCCEEGSSCNNCPGGWFEKETKTCKNKGQNMCIMTKAKTPPKCDESKNVKPPKFNCNQYFSDKLGWKGCYMMNGREDLPTVSADKVFDVSFLRHTIEGIGNEYKEVEKLGLSHSALLVQEQCGGPERESFFIEYDTDNFNSNLIFPKTEGNTLTWNNSGFVGWYPGWSSSWFPQADGQILAGVGISGTVINAWLDEIPAWRANHTQFQVWNAMEARYKGAGFIFDDNTCHSFTAWNLNTLYYKGASILRSNQVQMCGNFAPVVIDGNLVKADMKNAQIYTKVLTWYTTFRLKYEEGRKKNDDWYDLKYWFYLNPTFIFHDQNDDYWIGKLTDPYYLEQSLPLKLGFQRADSWSHSCKKFGGVHNLIV